MESLEPKRCPFCKSINIRVVLRTPYPYVKCSGYVRCLSCNARGPLYRFKHNEPVNEYPVIKMWNRVREDNLDDLPLFKESKGANNER